MTPQSAHRHNRDSERSQVDGGRPSALFWSRAGRLFGSFATAVLLLVTTMVVAISVTSRVWPQSHNAVFGFPVFIVASGSMSPAISTGDLVIDNPVTDGQASSLRAGQVITFASVSGSELITHRINSVNTALDGSVQYQTKGDANTVPDMTPVRPAQVVGTLRTRIPYGGLVIDAIRQPVVLLLLLATFLFWKASRSLVRAWASSPRPYDAAELRSPSAAASPDEVALAGATSVPGRGPPAAPAHITSAKEP